MVFDYDQLLWMNRSNLQATYRSVDYLSERHILFDLITPSQIAEGKLARYRAIVTPSMKYLAKNALTQLRRYAAGDSGRYSEAGELRTSPSGATLTFADLDELMAYPRFAVYLMKE